MTLPDIRFDTYYPYEPLSAILHGFVEAYPHLVQIQSIGKSYEGRDVWLLTVTNRETGPAEEKPAFWCDANIHATEVSPSSAVLYLLRRLVTGYGEDEQVTRLLDTRAIYAVPRVNPDGAEMYFADRPRLLRSSTRPYPFDEETPEGLEPQDIDGDGRMLQMRIPDPNGPWKQHPDEPRLLIRRDPVETGGSYYRLLPEGLLTNWDGITLAMKPEKARLDLNRNFPSNWRQEGEQSGAGPFPGSEPEAYNLMRFISEHPNITGAISFHTHGGVLLRPYGIKPDDSMPGEDLWTYQKIGAKGTEITGYRAVSTYHDFRYHPNEVITGVFDDWMFDHMGIFAWTCEIWGPQEHAGIKGRKFIEWYRDHPVEDDLKMIAWSDNELEGKAHVAWRPFDHPQLGPIEIGGWDYLYAFRNPPPKYLEKEIAPLAEWVIWHALISPRMELAKVDVESLGDDSYHITLVVDNTGWLPTYVTKRAVQTKAVRGIVVEIEIPEDATLKAGKLREEVGQLEGRAYKSSSPYGWTVDATAERLKYEWIVRSSGGGSVTVTARHARAGTVRKTVSLP
jgi:murein tripeptide amidase MpaA